MKGHGNGSEDETHACGVARCRPQAGGNHRGKGGPNAFKMERTWHKCCGPHLSEPHLVEGELSSGAFMLSPAAQTSCTPAS